MLIVNAIVGETEVRFPPQGRAAKVAAHAVGCVCFLPLYRKSYNIAQCSLVQFSRNNIGGRDICNLVVENKSARVIRRPKIGGRFSGTGDIFSAVVSGCLLKGKTLTESAQIAANFVSACVLDTVKTLHRPMYGVELEKNLNLLWKVK